MNETERNVILDALALAAEAWDEQGDKELAQTLHDRITNGELELPPADRTEPNE
jgi:hypothetical protein